MRLLLYYFFKVFISTGLFFYCKKIVVKGSENIPKKGALLFMANHPNGLIDPLIIATNIPRKVHFLVRAAVFKKPAVAKFFSWLGMMPIYRIRDGVQELAKNEAIFEECKNLLENQESILIFPEGSHLRKRTIRPLSKGFTRILFRTLEANPNLNIHIIPVGITYQNASVYPSKVALHFGKSILANAIYNTENPNNATKILKEKVTKQLEALSVSIPDDENYQTSLSKLNESQVDFTQVVAVNAMIQQQTFLPKKAPKKPLTWLKYLLIANSIIPYFIWKTAEQKVPEIEFVDTFRFALNLITFAICYLLQTWLVSYFFGGKIAGIYLVCSLLLVVLYTKLSATNAETN